jgi:hypothetical protein
MRFQTWWILLTLTLGGCAGDSRSTVPRVPVAVEASLSLFQQGPCGHESGPLNPKGGRFYTPVAYDPHNNEIFGPMRYGPVTQNTLDIEACPGSINFYDVPVPAGFTPDWFCNIGFSSPGQFGASNPISWVSWVGWGAKTTYYLYVYDDKTLLESYQIGPLKKKHGRLMFFSPFENFAIPTDGDINLEIVHPTA